MKETILAVVEEGLGLAVEVVLFGVLTTIGIFSEQYAIADLSRGDVLGLWYLVMGALALFAAAYLVGYLRLLPRLRRMLTRA